MNKSVPKFIYVEPQLKLTMIKQFPGFVPFINTDLTSNEIVFYIGDYLNHHVDEFGIFHLNLSMFKRIEPMLIQFMKFCCSNQIRIAALEFINLLSNQKEKL